MSNRTALKAGLTTHPDAERMFKHLETPEQLAALKAPSGGMVANGLYYPGGKYLPRLLKRIRDVRKNAQPVQLSRSKAGPVWTPDQETHLAGINPESHTDLGAFADRLQEDQHPLAPVFRRFFQRESDPKTPQVAGQQGPHTFVDDASLADDYQGFPLDSKNGELASIRLGTAHFDHADGKRKAPAAMLHLYGGKKAVWGSVPLRPEEWAAIHHHLRGKHRGYSAPINPPVALPEQLAREEEAPPASVARVLPSGTHSFKLPTLKHEELLGMEKEYGVPEKHRLSNSEGYSWDKKTGHIKSSKLEHLHKFLDYVTNKQIPKGLKGGKLFDHLVLHAVNDARSYMPLSDGAEWYGGSVKKLDEGLHDLLSREVPFDPKSKKIENHELWGRKGEPTAALRLFKNMVGFTSNNQKPVDNLASALKILKTGIKKNPLRPFDGMDGYNVQPLHDYLEAVTKKYGPGDHHHVGMTPEQHTAWHNKYGADLKEQSKRGGGGVSSPFSVVGGLQDEAGNIVGRRNIAGKAMSMDGKTELPPAKYKEVPFPSPDAEGNLKAKGWSSRASTNAQHIQLLQNVIKGFGGDYEKAAAWLEQSHPHKEVEKVRGGKVERSGLLPHEDTPGSFIFGPKQGPFVRNISGDPQHVTQDVWWTRSINRWLGKLTKNDKAPSAPQKQLYARIARKASQELGMAPADLQAVLWYAEQHFHRLFGARNDSQDFAHAIKHALSSHGFDKENS